MGTITAATLWELVEQRAAATPDGEMLVDEQGRRVTFGKFAALAAMAAAGLAGLGVTTGTAVTWQLPTTIETLALAAALARIGAIQNPVIPGYGERNLEFVVRQTGAEFLITTEHWTSHALGEQARAVASRVPGLDVLLIGALSEADRTTESPSADGRSPVGTGPAGVRWIFYTSGTTAEPKGARHTDASVLASAQGMARALALTEDDRVGLVFPVAHIGGCGTWLGACLMSGCTLILDVAFNLVTTAELQQREHVTVAGSGTVFTQLYLGLQRKQPGRRLFPDARVLTAGAAPRPPQLHAEVKEEMGGIGVLSGYGMTEAPILTMAATTDPDTKLATTEGLPCPGVEFKVVDGELRVKAPQVMTGYVDEDLNKDAFDSDGYLRTGDLGTFDEDGYLTITGRLKEVIIRKGETISARAIEVELMTHPAIAEAVVIALPHPQTGEQACAIIVPRAEAATPDLDSLTRHLKERGLAPIQWPERLEIVTDLPRTSTGKVLKEALRARLIAIPPGDDSP